MTKPNKYPTTLGSASADRDDNPQMETLRANLESARASRDQFREQLASARQELITARVLLNDTFMFLCEEKHRKPLNESAADGTQRLSQKIAAYLDAANGRTAP